jgi:hypothetical protein
MALSDNSVTDAEEIGYGLVDPDVLGGWADDVVTDDEAIIECWKIGGSLWISANNVVVRKVWVHTTAPRTIYAQERPAPIEHVGFGDPDVVWEGGVGATK